MAVNRNPSIETARRRLGRSRGENPAGQADYQPQFGFSGLAKAGLTVADSIAASQESVVRQATACYEAQIRSRVDLDLAQAGFGRAQIEQLGARNQVQVANAELGRLLSSAQDADYVPAEVDTALTEMQPLPELIDEALANRPDLLFHRSRTWSSVGEGGGGEG